jgi:tetraacyldisaccharide 4'-kinase
MMKEPWFWRSRTPAARIATLGLLPAAALYDAARRLTISRAQASRPPLPVISIGNATLGGVGKTPFALMLGSMLKAAGMAPAFLTRGYGGTLKGPVLVDPSAHKAAEVGDEALLLAATAPTIVAVDRPAGAKAARMRGADIVLMDDGHQNRTIEKALSILLLDAAERGNGRLFPAGPLREPMREAEARADAIVDILDARPAAAVDGFRRERLRAWLEPAPLSPRDRFFAFCGIGAPERFFATLEREGVNAISRKIFADHHPYTERDLAELAEAAHKEGAALLTTAKDFVRINPKARENIRVLTVEMRIDDPDRLMRLVAGAVEKFNRDGAAPTHV